MQSQLNTLLSKNENQPILNPKYESEQASQLQHNLSKKLINEIESLTNVAANQEPKQADQTKVGLMHYNYKLAQKFNKTILWQVTYELFCTPGLSEANAQSDLAQFTDFEKRISELEKLLGSNTYMVPPCISALYFVRQLTKLFCSQGSMQPSDLLSVLDKMNQKISFLNPPELEKMDRKLKMLALDMDDFVKNEEKKSLSSQQEKKVNTLFFKKKILTKGSIR